MESKTTVLLDKLAFPEGPRWHDDRLWFSDMHAHRVMTVNLNGDAHTIVEVPGQPSGLGWDRDGRLLVVSMTDRRLLRLTADGLAQVADLSKLASYHCNDMAVDTQGKAYIGNFGYDIYNKRATPKLAGIVLVTPDGDTRVVADELSFPNGAVITPDGRTFIVGETFAARLSAFTIESDGSLTKRRVWAKLDEQVTPDGICLDAEGAIWVASPSTGEILRVREGGEITHRITLDRAPFACMLGATDRRTLFILTSTTHHPDKAKARASGRVEIMQVDVPGAGLP
jgi:sugar lactone lactonase YvrE